jgi:glutathione synthase/RimK-type ligase-like ATP-grasp enzyme
MKIAIHPSEMFFSDRWIRYCQEKQLAYKLVSMYDSDIIAKVCDCDIVMWHWSHIEAKDKIFAQQLIRSLEVMNKHVFPDSNTCWHFDDKIGQKYLFEAAGIPHVPTAVFYDKGTALAWLKQQTFPKVFKLRGGSGSRNVVLVKSYFQAQRLVKQAFGRGFLSFKVFSDVKTYIRKKQRSGEIWGKLLNAPKAIMRRWGIRQAMTREKGYVIFQEYIEGNEYDTRVVVIGDRAFGLRRYCRPNDFRASGSGNITYEPDLISQECLKIAFDTTRRLKLQCAAYDFIKDAKGAYLIVEVSYGFTVKPYDLCPGYWDSALNWHAGTFNPQYWMIEDIINQGRAE